MDYSLIINRKIIDILIGDKKVYNGYSLPYLSGPDLCQLCTSFGLERSYEWGPGSQNKSRWEYMYDLLTYLNKHNRVPDLLLYLTQKGQIDKLIELNPDDREFTYSAIIDGVINAINAQLVLAKVELHYSNGKFFMASTETNAIIETSSLKEVNSQYIRDLPKRIKTEIENKDFDSVITKSRTFLEEVFISIIEEKTGKRYNSNGDLVKIYQEATSLLNMRQSKEWDKRVNELLGGLHKIISAVSSMRNLNSDAHGVGSARISIKKREALLVANSSMMVAEYLFSVCKGEDQA